MLEGEALSLSLLLGSIADYSSDLYQPRHLLSLPVSFLLLQKLKTRLER